MDFAKTRCPFCYKHFCCSLHRKNHEIKYHQEKLEQENNLVEAFQKKAKDILSKAEKRNHVSQTLPETKNDIALPAENSVKNHRPPLKRIYHEMDKRILSTPISLVSKSRQILSPVYRLKSQNYEDSNSRATSEMKTNFLGKTAVIQTSTPIFSELQIKNSEKVSWVISPTSSIYQTPSNELENNILPNSATKTPSKKLISITTPLQSIMSKVSKYDYSNNMAQSPCVSITRSRRVTFSVSSIGSSNGNPLESVPDVAICHEVRDENTYGVESNDVFINCVASEGAETEGDNPHLILEDSQTDEKNGFFSCMASAFCSAILRIQSLASWHISEDGGIIRAKRTRSPDAKDRGLSSPQLKRRCYTFDLRQNPIKCRRGISDPTDSLLELK